MEKKIDINIQTKANTTGADKASRSVDQLESELQSLHRELMAAPVGTEQFDRLAGKIKETSHLLDQADTSAKKLGATMGRRGNGGMAALEFSRAFEDAQYGIRGVLNNIPSLVLQLGGTAGLAGVISITAVALTQLWERFGSGSKQATSDIDAIIERTKALEERYQKLGKIAIDQRAEMARDAERDLAQMVEGDRLNFRLGADTRGLEGARIEAEKRVELSRENLRLAELEARAIREGNADAAKLAAERLESVRRIREIEARAAEAARQKAEEEAQRAVQRALLEESAAIPENDRRLQEQRAIEAQIAEQRKAREEAEIARKEKIAQIQERVARLNREIAALESARGAAAIGAPEAIASLEAERRRLEGRAGDLKVRSRDEVVAGAKIRGLETQLEAAADSYRESNDELRALNQTVIELRSSLEALRGRNAIERDAEASIRADDNRRSEMQAQRETEQAAIAGVQGLIDQVGGGGSRELQAVLQEARTAIADGVLSGAELERLPLLFAQFSTQMQGLNVLPTKIEELIRVMDDINRRTTALEVAR